MPGRGSVGVAWRRTGEVTTLGQLFLALGRGWSAAIIYAYYLRLRLVAVKRKKGGSWQGGSGPGHHGTGMLGTIAGTALRRDLLPWKERMVEEYCAIMDEEVPSPSDARLCQRTDDAVRHLHALLLQDMRPPWVQDNFPQGLRGDATLSRYSRPCFVQWDTETASLVFGDNVVAAVAEHTNRVGLKLSGMVARPLYACTAVRDGKVCGAMASMSPLLEFSVERKEWLCGACRRSKKPVSDSVPRRILRLYPLVCTLKGHVTPMRFRPLIALVGVPPAEFSWGGQRGPGPCLQQWAGPNGDSLHYSEKESDAICLTARSFKGAA